MYVRLLSASSSASRSSVTKGKLVTPLEVMNKMHRLLPEQYSDFVHRLEVIRLRGEIQLLSGQITAAEKDALCRAAASL